LRASTCGFGYLAFLGMAERARAASQYASPLAVKPPHFPARAKRVVFLGMRGAPSHIDTFDYKPQLNERDGQAGPNKGRKLVGSPWKFQQHGERLWISELFPHLARHADKLCVLNAMHTNVPNHPEAWVMLHTGSFQFVRPSVGAWTLYGLGTENQSLPGFVVVSPAAVFQGAQLWSSSFLPSAYQGTLVRDLKHPIANLQTPAGDLARQRDKLDALRLLNELHKGERTTTESANAYASQLDARIASFELAFRMQRQAPEAFDIDRESSRVHALYGIGDPVTDLFGRQCLLARRLVERGVRFVQLFDAPANNAWDHHSGLRENLPKRCMAIDRPIAALLTDLKQRGLLDDTLVIWGGEFGRTPTAEGTNGREHHPFGFSMWLAGGGVKGGIVHGATDDFGWHSVHDKVHVHDLHATILHLMGLDHEKLTFRHGGRDYRLTDVYGNVVRQILRA
jgi:hypothetical protein